MTEPSDAAPPALAASDTTATLPAQEHSADAPTVVDQDVPPKDPGETKERRGKKPPWRIALEWLVLIAIALGIAFLIKSFLFQAFYIPSGSMEPTLQIGDRVLVNKLSYDLHDVNRGDIVVFEAPPNAATGGVEDLVKRVIGLPGDTVTFPGDGNVYVNGRVLKEPYLPKGVSTCMPSLPCPRSETSGGEVPPGCGAPDNGQSGCVVPDGKYLMLGDNREGSKDSRVFGPIAGDTIVGRVFVRIWPIGDIGFL